MNNHMLQILFCLCLQHPALLVPIPFDITLENLVKILSHVLTDDIRTALDEHIFLKIRVYLLLGTDIGITLQYHIVYLEIKNAKLSG